MMDEEDFIQAVLAAPDDNTPRLVYADWLDDRGDPKGEFIRVQCELQAIYREGAISEELMDRSDELVEMQSDLVLAHGEEWSAPLLPYVEDVHFDRGLVQSVRLSASQLSLHVDRIFSLAPITFITVTAPRSRLKGALRSERLRQLRGFGLRPCVLAEDDVAAIVDMLQAGGIERLVLSRCGLDDELFAAFRRLANSSLTLLDLSENRLRNGAAKVLADAPGFRKLQKLVLSGNDIRLRGAQALAKSKLLESLELLSIAANPLDARAVEVLRNRFEMVQMQ